MTNSVENMCWSVQKFAGILGNQIEINKKYNFLSCEKW
jgi:hypothetical protein